MLLASAAPMYGCGGATSSAVDVAATFGDQTFPADGCGRRVHYGECQPKNRAASYCFIVTSVSSPTPSATP